MNWVENRKNLVALAVLFVAGATVLLNASLLNIGGHDDDDSFLSIGGDDGLVRVGSSAYKQGQNDEKNKSQYKTYKGPRKKQNQASYDAGRESMRDKPDKVDSSSEDQSDYQDYRERAPRRQRQYRYQQPQTQRSYSDLNAHGPMYGSDVEAMR